MVLVYKRTVGATRLLQGEILTKVQEPQVEYDSNRITLIDHPRVIIVTPECDLVSDSSARSEAGDSDILGPKLLAHIHCCKVYEESELRKPSGLSSDPWKLVKQNQNERYYHIPAGQLEGQEDKLLPDFFLDFKRMFSIPTDYLYAALESGQIERQGAVPVPLIYQLVNKLFYFQGRVCIPDPNDSRELTGNPDAGALPLPLADFPT